MLTVLICLWVTGLVTTEEEITTINNVMLCCCRIFCVLSYGLNIPYKTSLSTSNHFLDGNERKEGSHEWSEESLKCGLFVLSTAAFMKIMAWFVTRYWFHKDSHPVNSRFRSSRNVQACTAVCQLLVLYSVTGMLQQTAGFAVHPELLLVDTWPASPSWPDLSLRFSCSQNSSLSVLHHTIYSLLTLSPRAWSAQISHEGSCLDLVHLLPAITPRS